ncbi:hypothetical protein COCVIDRAFT_84800 [Bipolaris victoriae FI3]|uniref:Bys1 family protein n=1 Tax=Bipolaris victoriae (strain FI3) TaxID=930091 RepID=W7FA26_BIPV3|nr:hypothetical protein COCVIDRAFT_84800 [Bipolaris victoriae FI3]
MRFIIPTLLALASSATAAGIAVILNNSPKPIYVWSVGSSVGPRNDIKAGGIYWEEMRRDEKTGGIAIKVTTSADGLYSGAPQQVFAYNLDNDTVWYDLSTVFGDPFAGYRLQVTGDNGGSILWPKGTHPGGSQLKSAPSEGNIFFSIDPAA